MRPTLASTSSPPCVSPRPSRHLSLQPNPGRIEESEGLLEAGLGDPMGTHYPCGWRVWGGFETRHGWWVWVADDFHPGGCGCVLLPPPGFPPAAIPKSVLYRPLTKRGQFASKLHKQDAGLLT
jgi:hypothetical protein